MTRFSVVSCRRGEGVSVDLFAPDIGLAMETLAMHLQSGHLRSLWLSSNPCQIEVFVISEMRETATHGEVLPEPPVFSSERSLFARFLLVFLRRLFPSLPAARHLTTEMTTRVGGVWRVMRVGDRCAVGQVAHGSFRLDPELSEKATACLRRVA